MKTRISAAERALAAFTAIEAHPITIAVAPLKASAMFEAEKNAREFVASVAGQLAAHDGDVNAFAPYPDQHLPHIEKQFAIGYYSAVRDLVKTDENREISYRHGQPHYCVMDAEKVEKMVEEMVDNAAASYRAYVIKLIGKIGDVTSAHLFGTAVWNHSVLKVIKKDGSAERWQTQMIVNVSSLGTYFNQWPTRLLKPVKATRAEVEKANDASNEEEAHCNAIAGGR